MQVKIINNFNRSYRLAKCQVHGYSNEFREQAEVSFYDTGGNLRRMWLPMPGHGRLSGTYQDYELVGEYDKGTAIRNRYVKERGHASMRDAVALTARAFNTTTIDVCAALGMRAEFGEEAKFCPKCDHVAAQCTCPLPDDATFPKT